MMLWILANLFSSVSLCNLRRALSEPFFFWDSRLGPAPFPCETGPYGAGASCGIDSLYRDDQAAPRLERGRAPMSSATFPYNPRRKGKQDNGNALYIAHSPG